MIHERERLPLGLEAGDDLPAVEPRLDDFERDFARDRSSLFGQPDVAHAAFAEPLEELVQPNAIGGRHRVLRRRSDFTGIVSARGR